MNEIETPLKPMGSEDVQKEDIQKLEVVLLLATRSRRDFIEKMREVSDKNRLTWIDSLAIATGASTREKVGMSITKIAEGLGRGEQTIRAHLTKTESRRLVRGTYEMLLRGKNVVLFQFLTKITLVEKHETGKSYQKKLIESEKSNKHHGRASGYIKAVK